MEVVRGGPVRGRPNRAHCLRGKSGWGSVARFVAFAGASIVLASLSLSALGPATAQAARVHPLELIQTLPNQEAPFAAAVDSTTHHFFVVSSDASNHLRVYNFQEDGQLDPAHPELTGAVSPEPIRVAVDNSGGGHAGYIYSVNLAGLRNPIGNVQQFDPEGEATAVTITEAAIPANETAQVGGLPPIVNNGSFEPRNVAVDGSGEVFVTDTSARAIDVFKPTGEFVRQIASAVSVGFPAGIAIDGPDLYIAVNGQQKDGALSPGLSELDAATGECVPVGCTPIDPAPIEGVAADEATGTIFTTGLVSTANGSEGKFSEYDAATGELLGVTRPKALHAPEGIAVDESSGKVIVGDTLPAGEGTLKFFGPEETVPDVATLTPEAVTADSSTLKGEVGAAGLPEVTCVLQYIDDEGFKADGFEGAAEAPCIPAGPFSGAAMNVVHAELAGLRGGTTYHERILGESIPGEPLKGSNAGADVPFTTLGPTVTGAGAVGITETTATLEGTVDPNGSPTTYRFQYLTQAQREATGWTDATEVPAGGAPVGSGSVAEAVSAPISGLVPGTAYRMRILAASTAGTTEGKEVAFTAQISPFGALSDGRAWEQVSPTQKNGGDIQGAIDSVQASLDGERITFFSNTGIPGGEGAQEFPTFMAQRSPGGWSTEGLLPPASYGPRASVLGWSEDLADTYDFATRPFEAGKLLRRQSPGGALTQAGTITSANNPLAYAGSSQGGAVALLESKAGGLLPGQDLEGKQNVYAYDRATGELVVAGVMNDGSVPAGGAMAGPYDWFKSGSTTGFGGALNNYYTQAGHAISADGSGVFFTAGGTGQLYVRLNPLAPQSAMSGEACTEAAKACTVRVSAPAAGVATDPKTPAAFLDASVDGSLVYFLDKGKLTTDATAGSGYDLYRYDVPARTLIDLTPDIADRNGARVEGMLGIGGPTGEDAYFAAAGQLATGATQAPVGQTNLYALHGTAIEFVARLGTGGASGEASGEVVDWVPSSALVSGSIVTHSARVSSDGQILLFSSARDLTAYAAHGKSELYLYRSGRGISCVSCNPSGEAPAGPAGVQQIPVVGFHLLRNYAIMTRNLSADGRRIFFDSPDRLVSADRNDVNDVYEWEADGEGSCASGSQDGGCLFLISGGAAGSGPSWFGDADEEGNNVFFLTGQPLVAQDRDELVDVYDARVGGGIVSQEEVPPVSCEGEAGCRGAVAPTPPSAPTPGSSTLVSPGNPKPPPHCRKGQVRKGGKCVKKPKSKKGKGKKNSKSKKHEQGKTSKKKAGKGKKGGKG
jgi:hypothetical protein